MNRVSPNTFTYTNKNFPNDDARSLPKLKKKKYKYEKMSGKKNATKNVQKKETNH